MNPRKPCRHCGHKYANRPKGLCWRCYHTRSIRYMYEKNYGGGGLGCYEYADIYGGYELPERPTSSPPGSEEKIQTMAERFAAKRRLWHPLDQACQGTMS